MKTSLEEKLERVSNRAGFILGFVVQGGECTVSAVCNEFGASVRLKDEVIILNAEEVNELKAVQDAFNAAFLG